VTAKEYISANEFVRDAFTLARDIYESGYRPDVLLVLWRGGTPRSSLDRN
jgi:hypoxanthine phosphoribosyltransferase